MRLYLALLLTPLFLSAMDLASIAQEPNLERRSQLSLEYATTTCTTLKDAYEKGDGGAWRKNLRDISDASDLSKDSLAASGKIARKDPRAFKRAELSLRQVLRRLEGFRDFVGAQDRAAVEEVRDHLEAIHDDLLKQIMARKPK